MDLKANFSGSMPEYYDRCLGPAWFDAFASDLVGRLDPRPPGDVLEIACGTGLVTAHLRDRLDPSLRLVATDISPGMLDYARAKLAGRRGIEWRAADALQLPFADREFGAVVCAFGVMYFPDKVAGLREVRRVLKDDGAFLFNVFDRIEENPCAVANARLFEELFPGDREAQFGTPFELHDTKLLRKLLGESGFEAVKIETKRVTIEGVSARSVATGQMRGSPRGALVEKRGISIDQVVDQATDRLSKVGGADPFRSTAQAIVIEARPRG